MSKKNINEGTLDLMRKTAAGIGGLKSGMGFSAGFNIKDSDIKTQQLIKTVTTKAMENWAKYQSAIMTGQPNKIITINDITTWAGKYFKMVITTAPDNTNINSIMTWVSSLVADAVANKMAPQTKQEIAKEAKIVYDNWIDYKQLLESSKITNAVTLNDFITWATKSLNYTKNDKVDYPASISDDDVKDWCITYVAYNIATTGNAIPQPKRVKPAPVASSIPNDNAIVILKNLFAKRGKKLTDAEASDILNKYAKQNPNP